MSMQEKQHINVFVRIKPVSTTACDEKCIVEMISDKEIMVYERSQDKTSKMFTFDGVFGPSSTQVDVYDTVVSPLVKEVIAGYNCTVFAYGQTGTGKTYTMEGDRADNPNLHWQSDTSAGMIPRCLSHLFDELQLLENQQYTVRVNFLELYNEELIDLLMDGNDTPSKIKLYEDVTKKGSVIIHGLDEMTVHSKAEIYRILEKGSERRQTAATMLNSNSSRSHTVFSITIHTKENTSGGEELLKTAKLNLVDLAGSEHVGRSGAVEKRAREARSINQSLLTLGRVITALVEKAPHVPYRESKLTRLLQESLGGRTKTSIIATVSSASGNLEETLSTLDYAYRAKNITNRPEINQKICKRALLKEYTKEIERLKRDLVATRERNGVYVSFSDYDAMQTLIDCQRKEVKKKKNYCQVLEDVIQNKEKIFNDLRYQYDAQVGELTKNTSELNDINGYLRMTKESLRQVECVKNEQKRRVDKYVETERILHTQMKTILNVVNEASEDAQKLHDKLDRKTKVEEENKKLGLQMRSDFTKRCGNIEDVLVVQKKEIHALLQSVKDEVETHVTAQAINIEASIRSIVDSAVYQHYAASKESKKDINTFYTHYQKELDTHMQNASAIMETENKLLNDIFSKLVPDVRDLLESSYNGVMQNLQFLSRNIDQKLESVSMYAKHAVETVRRNRLEERNYLLKSLREISEDIKGISLNEKQRMENYKKFGKKMKNLSRGFNLLDKCERDYSEIIDTSHRIDETCSNVYDQSSHGYNTDIIKQNDLKDFLQNNTLIIKSNIDSGVNQMQISNKTAIEKGNVLVTDLQERLSTSCATLHQHNNNVQFIGKQLQEKMAKDENKILISSANIFKTVEDTRLTHDKFMKKQQSKISEASRMMDDKFMNQRMGLNNIHNNIIEELGASQQQIDKFLTEDFCRDVCTGTTPERKIFSYPRELTTMSPSERIIQRFQEDKNYLDEAEVIINVLEN
ncbi:kinesin-like protein Klp61F isoform X1 [Temnothorax americanus]|uniref:kinesin-like protein Klp61F isoform X1 n=1 Tax=Temnothorax americanus TaxID=1964332 RepID=UPI0040695F6A